MAEKREDGGNDWIRKRRQLRRIGQEGVVIIFGIKCKTDTCQHPCNIGTWSIESYETCSTFVWIVLEGRLGDIDEG